MFKDYNTVFRLIIFWAIIISFTLIYHLNILQKYETTLTATLDYVRIDKVQLHRCHLTGISKITCFLTCRFVLKSVMKKYSRYALNSSLNTILSKKTFLFQIFYTYCYFQKKIWVFQSFSFLTIFILSLISSH